MTASFAVPLVWSPSPQTAGHTVEEPSFEASPAVNPTLRLSDMLYLSYQERILSYSDSRIEEGCPPVIFGMFYCVIVMHCGPAAKAGL
jgi:hypothetical protein